MTLFRHFPAKDALLLDGPFDPLMAEAVRGRPPGEPPLRALAGGIDESWREIDSAEVERLRTVLSIVVATPTLQGAIERNSARTTEALADALIDRGAAEPDAHVAAAAVIAGLARKSEEHTSELQSRGHLVCRLLLEKKKHIQRS